MHQKVQPCKDFAGCSLNNCGVGNRCMCKYFERSVEFWRSMLALLWNFTRSQLSRLISCLFRLRLDQKVLASQCDFAYIIVCAKIENFQVVRDYFRLLLRRYDTLGLECPSRSHCHKIALQTFCKLRRHMSRDCGSAKRHGACRAVTLERILARAPGIFEGKFDAKL